MDQPPSPPPWAAPPSTLTEIFGPDYNKFYTPILYIITNFAFASYILGNTHRRSFLRYLAVLALGANLYVIHLAPPTFTYHIFWSSLISSQLAVHFFGGVDKLLITRWTYEGCHPPTNKSVESSSPSSNTSHGHPTIFSRTLWGFNSLLSYRAINTPHTICKGIHPVLPSPHSTKRSFLSYHLTRAFLTYLLLDTCNTLFLPLLTHTTSPPWPAHRDNLFLTRLTPLTTQEILWRYTLATTLWLPALLLLNLIFDIFAIVLVSLNLTPISHWPEIFGPLSLSYTLRGFWGGFWHQLLRQPMNHVAICIVHDLLRMRRGRWWGRCAVLYMTFLLSGVVHWYQDGCLGLWGGSRAVWYFQVQAVGVVVEGVVVEGWRRWVGVGKGGDEEEKKWYHWTHLVGFLWVATWFACWDIQWKGPYMRQQEKIGVRAFPSLIEAVKGWNAGTGGGGVEKEL